MKKNFAIPAIVSFVFMALGFLLLHYGLFNYGISFFAFLPFILGYILGKSAFKFMGVLGLIFSFCLFCFIIIELGQEGIVCILMASPFIIFSFLLGFLARVMYLRMKNKEKKESDENILDDDEIMKNSLLPLCILLIAGIAEKQLTINDNEIVEIESKIILPYSPLEVYETIKSVDTLDVEKPFLMKLDLPVPLKCVLEEERIGGKRVCYFKEGKIIEEITALEKGKLLQMDVIDYELTGRTWLGFKEAIYTFEELKTGECKMKRITTYTSELYPRFYWRPLERMGIEQEHGYVFSNLEKDLKSK